MGKSADVYFAVLSGEGLDESRKNIEMFIQFRFFPRPLKAKRFARMGDRVMVLVGSGGEFHFLVRPVKTMGAFFVAATSTGKHIRISSGVDEVINHRKQSNGE